MADLRGLIERKDIPKGALTELLNHMASFACIGFDQKFAPPPATATWESFSPVERAAARLAALALLRSLLNTTEGGEAE